MEPLNICELNSLKKYILELNLPPETLEEVLIAINKKLEENTFEVQIINCSKKTFWYEYQVGKIYKVIDDGFNPDYYAIRDSKDDSVDGSHYLLKEDCKIIN